MIFFFETASEEEEKNPQEYIQNNSFLHKYNPRVENISKAPRWRIYPHILIDINSLEELISLIEESEYPVVVYGQDDHQSLSGEDKCIHPTIKLYDDYLE